MHVGIRELKRRLSEYVARARQGETVVVTDRGMPVAHLSPVISSEPSDRVAGLVKAGLLIYKPPPRDLPVPFQMTPGEKTSTDYVAEQRR